MPYTQGASNASGPYIAAGTQTYQQANNAEYQYSEATLSFEQDLFTAFVYSGGVCTKDGTTASQLDVTACVAFILQADATLRRRSFAGTNFSTSGHPSTTMYLDFNPDGTTSWATTHSGQANYLPLCSVTTDVSANIVSVTDARTLSTALLGGMVGGVGLGQVPSGHISSGARIGIGLDGSAIPGIQAWSANAVLASGSGVPVLNQNCYNDGTNDRFMTTGFAQQVWLDATGVLFFRRSTASGSANGVITWNAAQTVPLTGPHSNAQSQVQVSMGNGVPGTLAANEVYFQLS